MSECNFEKNVATMKGDDIFVEKTFEFIEMSDILIKESYKNSIYIYLSNVVIDSIQIENNNGIGAKGGGLFVVDAISFELNDAKFLNLQSMEGGALYFTQTTNDVSPYYVTNIYLAYLNS